MCDWHIALHAERKRAASRCHDRFRMHPPRWFHFTARAHARHVLYFNVALRENTHTHTHPSADVNYTCVVNSELGVSVSQHVHIHLWYVVWAVSSSLSTVCTRNVPPHAVGSGCLCGDCVEMFCGKPNPGYECTRVCVHTSKTTNRHHATSSKSYFVWYGYDFRNMRNGCTS